MESKIENSINEFKKYTENFDFSNDMISRKYYHTFRVVEYAKRIAESENLNEHDSYIAFVCALLHDISRFKQAKEFNTFVDLKSFDHGDVSCDILLENNYISNFVESDIDKNIVLKAIKCHNKFSIDNNLNDRELFFAKLLRDADKLDILDKQKNEITDKIGEINPIAIEDVMANRLHMRDDLVYNDATESVYRLCLIFDINFNISFKIILENKVIEKKISGLRKFCDADIVDKIEKTVNDFVKKFVN